MVVFLHGDNPGNVIEGHSTNAEVFIIRDLADFANETIQVWGRDAIDSSKEVGWCKAVMVSRGTTALRDSVSGKKIV